MHGDPIAAVAAFLLDAARGDVSGYTVVQVLQHWVDEGTPTDEIHLALDSADQACPARHRAALERYRRVIAARFPASPPG